MNLIFFKSTFLIFEKSFLPFPSSEEGVGCVAYHGLCSVPFGGMVQDP